MFNLVKHYGVCHRCIATSYRRSSFYAVIQGRIPGIYDTWSETKEQIHEFGNGHCKKFKSLEEATLYYEKYKVDSNSKIENTPLHDEHVDSIQVDTTGCDHDSLCITEDGFLVIYCDGSRIGHYNGEGFGGIGVYFGPNHKLNQSLPLEGKVTNNRAELVAAATALRLAKVIGFEKVEIRTDSMLIVNCMTSWVDKWKKNGWKTANKKHVANVDDLIRLDNLTRNITVRWVHVKGHSSSLGNNEADSLARNAAEALKEKG